MTEEETNAMFDQQIKRADELEDMLFRRIAQGDEDPIGVLFSMWISMIHYLAEVGFTASELAAEVQTHVALQLSDGTSTEPD